MADMGSDDDPEETPTKSSSGRNKSRRELPAGAVATLKAWLLSPEHFTHPYPTPQDQAMLMQKTGIDKKQLKNWFTNARRRIWKPMLKKQLEQGKLQATGAGGGGVALPGVVPGLMVPALHGAIAPQQAQQQQQQQQQQQPHNFHQDHDQMRANYQQAIQQANTPQQQQQQQPPEMNAFGSHSFIQHQPQPGMSNAIDASATTYYNHQQQQQQQTQEQGNHMPAPQQQDQGLTINGSLTSLPTISTQGQQQTISKTDSHAVLMELFARDQDLVREAEAKRARNGQDIPQQQGAYTAMQPGQSSSSGGNDASHSTQQQNGMSPELSGASYPNSSMQHGFMQQQQQQQQQPHNDSNSFSLNGTNKHVSQGRLAPVPTLNSWPHFSSISSLNNLGTMPGVKSITSLSGADLANQGPVNRVGNLAQVKSQESMGKTDSFAFLEVLFDKNTSSNNISSLGGGASTGMTRWMKRDRDEDNDVGLSLEDEGPSTASPRHDSGGKMEANEFGAAPSASFFPQQQQQQTNGAKEPPANNLKRSFDATLAARGLLAVSRSSEKLTDLDLPKKIQRTLSQEFLRNDSQQQQQQQQQQQHQGNLHMLSGGFQPYNSQQDYNSSNNDHTPNHHQQQPGDHQLQNTSMNRSAPAPGPASAPSNSQGQTGGPNSKVQVPTATKCALCHQTNVDTQLKPCGHMFHEKCLKPSLHACSGPPKCPVDHIPMQSALLAVPTDENLPNVSHAINAPSPIASPSSSITAWGSAPALAATRIKSESS